MTEQTEPPRDLSVSEWEKKAELAMMEEKIGEAMKYAHYANLADS